MSYQVISTLTPDATLYVSFSSYMRAPYPTAVVNVPAPDPWAWSIDTVVALVGALASMLVAVLAIAVTVRIAAQAAHHRQKELEDERGRRTRAERKLVSEAVRSYWTSIDERGDDRIAHERLVKSFAEGDVEEEPLYRWAVESGQKLFSAYFLAHEDSNPDSDDPGPPTRSWLAYRATDAALHGTLREWVRSGRLTTFPLPTDSQAGQVNPR